MADDSLERKVTNMSCSGSRLFLGLFVSRYCGLFGVGLSTYGAVIENPYFAAAGLGTVVTTALIGRTIMRQYPKE